MSGDEMVCLMTQTQIRIERKSFPAGPDKPEQVILSNLEFNVRDGEFLCLIGPSGCGKSTLLNMVAGIDTGFSGQIDLGSRNPRIAYMFQEPRLLPWRTVGQNIRLGLPKAASNDLDMDELLAELGVSGCEHHFPRQLSLGMQRRVALARAFAIQPDLLLMDEPFVSLDEPNAQRLRRLLVDIWRRHRTSVIFVTHDIREALELADRVIVLSGTPARLVHEVHLQKEGPAIKEVDMVRMHREISGWVCGSAALSD